MVGSFLIRTILEVERKFSNIAVKDLTSHAGNPPFRTLQRLRPQKFTDVYYDKSNILSTNGVWIRRRDGLWQAKVRQGGDFSNSKFEEITDPLEIARYARELAGGEGNQVDCFGLKELATLTTFRQSWLADDEFRIVLDQTDFGHTVGEVELQRSIQFEPDAHSAIAQLKEAEMKEMDSKIIQFMDRYSLGVQACVELSHEYVLDRSGVDSSLISTVPRTRGSLEHSKHLNAIPNEAYMKPPNIYLVGAQCTGKTTLLEALEEYFSNAKERDESPCYTDAPAFIREAATQVMHNNGFNSADVTDPERGFELQKSILMAQYKAEETLRDRWYISDRSGIDPIVYAQVYLGNHSAEKLLSSPEWVCLREWMRRSTVILCTPGNEEWLNDNDVRLKYGRTEEWEEFSYEFSKVLERQTIDFKVLPGRLTSLEQRVGFVIDTFSFSGQTRG